VFISSALLWAQFDFVNFVVPATSPNICQVTLIVSTLFDQVARVSIGGFLLWSVGHATKSSAERYGLGALLGLRVVAGGVFIAFTRPQFAPICVARSSLLPASITVLALDAIIIGTITIRVFTLGLLKSAREVIPSTMQEQSKSLLFCTLGFVIWTGVRIRSARHAKDCVLNFELDQCYDDSWVQVDHFPPSNSYPSNWSCGSCW
jgi:hypothetical protein